jgi:hypothetical protein
MTAGRVLSGRGIYTLPLIKYGVILGIEVPGLKNGV